MSNSLITARDAFAARLPEERMDLNGRSWGVRFTGSDGPVLLLIPGTLGRGDVFWQQVEALSNRLRIVTVSYPETGSIADWSADLQTLFDRLEIGEATVLGSSLGGYLVQYLASEAPERVTRLIAANTLHSVAGITDRPPYALDLDTVPVADLRAGFAKGLGAWAETHPDQVDLVELLLGEVNGRIPEPELRMRLKALKTAPELPPVKLSTDRIVTIEADDDPLIPPEMRSAVRDRLNPAVAYRFLSGGHFPYVARPSDYTALLEQVMGLEVTGPDWGEEAERSR
ncbi:alpha/beta fold hydrolase [Roseibium sp.]|uniref:alpha/beta fold hydrolase n=1 Tax=Roseibium sp. TaxID=1936156 RepID=UPI003A968DAF